MVPCLNHSSVYIKRKLRVWRVQKYIPLVGAKTALTCAGLLITTSHVRRYRAENGNFRKFWCTFHHGTVVPCLHQNNLYIKRTLRVWRVQKYIPLVGSKTVLTCAGLQTTPSHMRQYWAANENLRKFGSTFRNGTMFAPKQCLYQKEAAGIESPKMYSSSRCKNRTYLCGPENYPIWCEAYRAENGNFRKFWFTFHHCIMFASKQSSSQKEATGMESPKMYLSSRCKNRKGKLRKFRSTFCHGTMFAPKQCLYWKEAAGMESPKM